MILADHAAGAEVFAGLCVGLGVGVAALVGVGAAEVFTVIAVKYQRSPFGNDTVFGPIAWWLPLSDQLHKVLEVETFVMLNCACVFFISSPSAL